jgi:S-DNA-T family DNA segregation ATPase FtsK/SpoIIIE
METLNSLIRELDQRYDMFNKAHVRSIQEYNRQYISRKITNPEQHRYLPYFVVVIDEFADLATARVNAFPLIIRIAKLGRPAGVHLIIATQRPSVNIITGDIKANFTARLVCKVATSTDSRTIIDNGGAEKLEGDGDMLFYAGHQTTRLQGAWVTTEEVLRLAEYIGAQQGYPTAMYLPEYPADVVAKLKFDPDTLDPFFAESALLIVIHQQGSRSLIQRKLKLGYNRAGRIIDQLEAAGVVGPSDGAKARDVLFTDEDALQTYLKTIMPAAAEPAVVKQAPLPTPISVPAPEPKKGILSWLFKR